METGFVSLWRRFRPLRGRVCTRDCVDCMWIFVEIIHKDVDVPQTDEINMDVITWFGMARPGEVMENGFYCTADSWIEEQFVVPLNEFGAEISRDKDAEGSVAVTLRIAVCHCDNLRLAFLDVFLLA